VVTEAVHYALTGSVATLTMDQPDSRNALGPQMLQSLVQTLRMAAADEAVRVVVLTGAGSTFCSGADLRGGPAGAAFAASGPGLLVEVLRELLDHPKPTIARVQGHVAGGGIGLVAACDLAVAAASARFAFSEVRLGVSPAVVAVACLRVMAPRDAAELMLTGERVWAERARTAGLLTAVVESDALDATVASWAQLLGLGAPGAVAATKQLLRTVSTLDREEAFAWTAELSSRLFAGPEAAEGIEAFMARRPPSWAPPG
jgi:methylglutaconyl-CoA hydratase